MTDQSTPYEEIVRLRSKEPEKVYIERDDIHHFWWRFEASSILNMFQESDYEPVMINRKDRTTAISRFHWDGLIAWLSPILEGRKPIADFHTDNHIPILLTRIGRYRKIRNPKDIITRTYLEIFFEPFVDAMLEGRLDLTYSALRGYVHKFSDDKPIPDRSSLLKRKYDFLMIIGDQSLAKLNVLRTFLLEFALDDNLITDCERELHTPL